MNLFYALGFGYIVPRKVIFSAPASEDPNTSRHKTHPTILHHTRLQAQPNPRPLLDPRHAIIMLITRPNGQVFAIAREREARDLVDKPGILLHSFLGNMVPNRDRLVRSTRGERVVAVARPGRGNKSASSLHSYARHLCLHGMISDRINRVDAIHPVHCGTMTPKSIPLRLSGFRRVRVFHRYPSLDRARCPACTSDESITMKATLVSLVVGRPLDPLFGSSRPQRTSTIRHHPNTPRHEL